MGDPRKKPPKFLVERTRHHKPHRDLMEAAYYALEDAKEERARGHYDQLTTILLSALAVEAVANTFGEALIPDWDKFERKETPKKLRLVSEALGICYDARKEPWNSANWLRHTRNELAHGQPELVNSRKFVAKNQIDTTSQIRPKSGIEAEISLKNSVRAYETAEAILDTFIHATPEKQQHRFRGDGWSHSVSL